MAGRKIAVVALLLVASCAASRQNQSAQPRATDDPDGLPRECSEGASPALAGLGGLFTKPGEANPAIAAQDKKCDRAIQAQKMRWDRERDRASAPAIAEQTKTAPDSSTCSQRSGTFVITYSERSGNCGAIAESLTTVTRQPLRVEAPCKGVIDYSPDNCKVTFDSACPIAPGPSDAGGIRRDKAVIDWDASGAHARGIEQVTVMDDAGKRLCEGTYNIFVERR